MTAGRQDELIVLAVIVGAHGIKGDVRLKCFLEDPARLKKLGPFETTHGTLDVTQVRLQGKSIIVHFTGVSDRNAAEAMRGTRLCAPRHALGASDASREEYLAFDLIGLAARSAAGLPVGEVVEVENFGAGDILEIERPDGKRFMVPFRKAVVPQVDLDGRSIVIADDYCELP